MRLLIADCSVEYTGKLSAHLPWARRLIIVKADGTVIIHGDRGHKALNWMSPPCRIEERDGGWTVHGPRGERLEIDIDEVIADSTTLLGEEPGLRKTGSEHELQALLAANPDVIEPGLRFVEREFPTDLGPVDIICRDEEGTTVVVEVKRIGEMQAVEQLSRYLERMARDPALVPLRGVLVAQTIKPQTRVLAASRDIGCVEVDFELLAGRAIPDLTLF